MASRKTLNARNLETLGAPRLAALLMEISKGDAAAKRRLRMELAGNLSPDELARESSLSGKAIPEKPLAQLATEALERLGVDVYPSRLENAYNTGATTQVPTGRVIGVKGRVSRKIGYDGKYINLERTTA